MANIDVMEAIRTLLGSAPQNTNQQVLPIPNPAVEGGNAMLNSVSPMPPQVDLGRIPVVKNILPTPPPQAPQSPQPPQGGRLPQWLLPMLAKMAIPAAATVAGSVNKNWLPQMSGLSTGYAEGMKESEDRALKNKQFEASAAKSEQDKWDDAYRTALSLSKTGVMGAMQEMTPAQLDALARQVYDVRYGKQSKKSIKPKNESKQYVNTGIDETGKKFGMLEDGTIEEIK